MERLSEYVLRLVCGTVVCSLLTTIGGTTGGNRKVQKTLCGLFLVFLAVSPLRELEISAFLPVSADLMRQSERYVQAGTLQRKNAVEDIIKAQCASYILTKAETLRLQPGVEVELNPDTGAPVAVNLSGDGTPYEKAVLCDYIIQTLGIGRDCIRWDP